MKSSLWSLFLVSSVTLTAQTATNPCPPSTAQGEHIVQSGETLYGISKKYKTTVAKLCEWNTLQETSILHPCDKLKVEAPDTEVSATPDEKEVPKSYYIAALQPKGAPKPSPSKTATISKSDRYKSEHIVKSGETLDEIAMRYGYTPARLLLVNNMKDAKSLKAGQRLKLSDCECSGEAKTPPSVADKKIDKKAAPPPKEPTKEAVKEPTKTPENTPAKVATKPTPKNVVKEVADVAPKPVAPAASNEPTPNYLYFQNSQYAPLVHITNDNETPASIAKLYGLTAGDVMMMNNLRDNTPLKGDLKLLIEDRNSPKKNTASYLLSDSIVTNAPNAFFDSEQIKIPYPSENVAPADNTGAAPVTSVKIAPVPVKENTNKPKTDGLSENRADIPPLSHATSMTTDEIEMVKEINLIRRNPSAYIPYVEEYIKYLKDNGDWMGSSGTAMELIEELKKTPPLALLEPKECVYVAATKHGEDQRRKRDLGHKGSDGSNSWDRILKQCTDLKDGGENLVGGQANIRRAVITLLVDHGISDHLHRKTLLNPDWKYVACRKLGTVGDMPHCWIQNFGY